MTITYCRNDPVSGRWLGVNRLLTEFEVDFNFFQHEGRITTLEANFTLTVSIGTITQPVPDQLLFTMTDGSTQGPFTLPTSTFQDRGAWTPSTPYFVNDTFTANGALYRVLFAHTSGTTFSPTANDGAGHDFYAAMMSSPGNALPTGGATGQVLQKSTGTDFAVMWGNKLPTGGTTNQVLLKLSATNQDASWATLGATMVSFTPSTASTLTSTNVSSAIEEIDAALNGFSASLSGLSDVRFGTGDPITGSFLYFGGSSWNASAPITPGDLLSWDGSTLVGVTPTAPTMTLDDLTDVTITSPSGGDTLVFDGASLSNKWVKRSAYNNLGSTGSAVVIGLFATTRFTPTASLQIAIGGTCRAGEKTTLIIVTSGTTSFNITSGPNVAMNGTLATGTTSGKVWTLTFIYDASGTTLYEIARTGPM